MISQDSPTGFGTEQLEQPRRAGCSLCVFDGCRLVFAAISEVLNTNTHQRKRQVLEHLD